MSTVQEAHETTHKRTQPKQHPQTNNEVIPWLEDLVLERIHKILVHSPRFNDQRHGYISWSLPQLLKVREYRQVLYHDVSLELIELVLVHV